MVMSSCKGTSNFSFRAVERLLTFWPIDRLPKKSKAADTSYLLGKCKYSTLENFTERYDTSREKIS